MGFELDLREGLTLKACHVPMRKGAYLGIQEGTTFTALARFISDEDMEYLYDILASRVFVIELIGERS